MAQERQAIQIPDFLTVRELADMVQTTPLEIMKRLIANGIMASINQQIDYDTAAIVIEDMGFEAVSSSAVKAQQERANAANAQAWRRVYSTERPETLQRRAPVVTILGHVDHGKTTLLDTIRAAHVAEGEAGGITQHIGAYRVSHDNRQITFMDTPGHEAFTAMRARGAQGADVAVLVVAADDGVMPTTREALNHAKAANIPVVVAITKVDKRNANAERVKQQLSELGLTPDDWGGETLFVPVSAYEKTGIEDLLEALLLVADGQDIVANPKGEVSGVVVEARMEPSRGATATLLVQNGTLARGEVIVAGEFFGRIRAMFDEHGKPLKEAGPSTPVAVLGLNGTPVPGDTFQRVKSEKDARAIAQQARDMRMAQQTRVSPILTLENVFAHLSNAGQSKELNLIVKADVRGSLEPVVESLHNLEDDATKLRVRILASEIGNVSDNDVMLASASGAIIIAFNVDVDNSARRTATSQGVDIRQYNVIYTLLDDIELALRGMLEPEYRQKTIGTAEVRQVFRISRVGAIAGCMVRDGEVRRNARARVLRSTQTLVQDSAVSSLKRFNEDVREVRAGFECGIGLADFNDFQEGDLIEFFISERVS